MSIERVNESLVLRKRFVKDKGISVGVLESPYFEERLSVLGESISYYEFLQNVRLKGGEQAYLTLYDITKDKIIDFIKATEAFQRFDSEDMDNYAVNLKLPSKDIFHPSNIGNYFLSIDMRKANFNCLRQYDATMFDNCENWEDFVRKFTDDEHIVTSKYIRQVVMGVCNPKRQVTYEKYLMSKLVAYAYSVGIQTEDIAFFSNDELILKLGDKDAQSDTEQRKSYLEKVHDVHLYALHNFLVPMHTEVFRLGKVQNTKGYFKKFVSKDAMICEEGCPIELKCLEGALYSMVYKVVSRLPLEDSDLVVSTDFGLARLLETPKIVLSFDKPEGAINRGKKVSSDNLDSVDLVTEIIQDSEGHFRFKTEKQKIEFGLPYGISNEDLCKTMFGEVTEENLNKVREARKRYFEEQPSLTDLKSCGGIRNTIVKADVKEEE